MNRAPNISFQLLFRIACLITTISLSVYWFYKFSLNKDLIAIEYKKYYAQEKDVYPMLSICLRNPISETKLRKINPTVSVASYIEFLSGNYFDPKLLDIDYLEIIENMADYVEDDFIRFRNGSYLAIHPAYKNDRIYGEGTKLKNYRKRIYPSKYAFFSDDEAFLNCYELSIPPDRNIRKFWFRINTKIFPSRIRPKSYGFMTILHYPNQALIAKTLNYLWSHPWNENKSHDMQFQIRGVEVLRRRQKWQRPCHEDWSNYDHYIMKKHVDLVGCRAPYLLLNNRTHLCRTKKQMEKRFYFRVDGVGLGPPCREMKKIYESYTESTHNQEEISWSRKGYFWLSVTVLDDDFKEISETRYKNK